MALFTFAYIICVSLDTYLEHTLFILEMYGKCAWIQEFSITYAYMSSNDVKDRITKGGFTLKSRFRKLGV